MREAHGGSVKASRPREVCRGQGLGRQAGRQAGRRAMEAEAEAEAWRWEAMQCDAI